MKASNLKQLAAVSTLVLGMLAASPASAADGSVMYRCPNNEYSNTIGAKEAKDRGCRVIEGAPVSIIQGARPRSSGGNAGSGSATASTAPSGASSGMPTARVDPVSQRARDSDARTILEAELRAEEERLGNLQKEFNSGQPERQGNERNYQKYLDRVNELRASITRKEGDIAAIRRELGKLSK